MKRLAGGQSYMNENNKVIIHHNKDNNEVTFQAIGNSEFVESMTDKVLKEYFGYQSSEAKTYVRAFGNEGYHGEVIHDNKENTELITDGKRTHNVTGETLYRCRYICPNCDLASNRYITENTTTIYCHDCNEALTPKSNKEEYNEAVDKFGNYYFAGKYVPYDLM